MWYLSPLPDQEMLLSIYSGNDYYSGRNGPGYTDYISYARAHAFTYGRLLRQLSRKGITGGSLLEIGCGMGYFLKTASKHFPYRAGIEMAEEAANAASRWADEMTLGTLETYKKDKRFDLVVALQVIEHVPDPLAFLERCRELIKDGGHLLITTPDMGSPLRRILGAKWPSFKIPEHLNFFERSTLALALKKSGFRHIESIPLVEAFPFHALLKAIGIYVPIPVKLGQIPIVVPRTSIAVLAEK